MTQSTIYRTAFGPIRDREGLYSYMFDNGSLYLSFEGPYPLNENDPRIIVIALAHKYPTTAKEVLKDYEEHYERQKEELKKYKELL